MNKIWGDPKKFFKLLTGSTQSERKEEIRLDSEETSVGCCSNDDDYRNERVNAGIDPRPDLLHQSVVTVGSAAVRHVVAVQLPCTM